MFGPGGYAYVYLIYGMHCCMNVVAATVDQPQAVLLRAVAPAPEWGDLRRDGAGPGKLCQAPGHHRDCYGLDLCQDRLYLLDDGFSPRTSPGPAASASITPERPGITLAFLPPRQSPVSGGKAFR